MTGALWVMSVEVACETCHRTFPLETHSGLVRCKACEARTGLRLAPAAANVIEFDGVWA